jgi:uncharacterized membrane protein YkvA (DUF1232 family)
LRYGRGNMSTEALDAIAEAWLSNLQQDIKEFVRVVCDDPELEESLRDRVHGAVFYALVPGDVIPDSIGVLGYLDDALALRVALDEVRREAPDRFDSYRERIPELVESTGEALAVFRESLDEETYESFRQRVFEIEKVEFKGRRASEVAQGKVDAGWLAAEVSVLALKLDFKPAAVRAAVKRVDSAIQTFHQRLQSRR